MLFKNNNRYYSSKCYYIHYSCPPPNTAPPLSTSPNTVADFQVPNLFFLGYVLIEEFLYRHFPIDCCFSQDPRAAVLGGRLYYILN